MPVPVCIPRAEALTESDRRKDQEFVFDDCELVQPQNRQQEEDLSNNGIGYVHYLAHFLGLPGQTSST